MIKIYECDRHLADVRLVGDRIEIDDKVGWADSLIESARRGRTDAELYEGLPRSFNGRIRAARTDHQD